jgi:hypothetical protein
VRSDAGESSHGRRGIEGVGNRRELDEQILDLHRPVWEWHELHAATHRPSGDARICRCAYASWTSNAVLNAGERCTAGRVKERIVPRYDARPASQCVEPTAADAVRECGGEWLLIDGRSLHSTPREVVLDADDEEPRELVVAAERATIPRVAVMVVTVVPLWGPVLPVTGS